VAHANTAAGVARTEQARRCRRRSSSRPPPRTRQHVQAGALDVEANLAGVQLAHGALTGNLPLWDFGQAINRWNAAEACAVGLGDTGPRRAWAGGARLAFFRARGEGAGQVAERPGQPTEAHWPRSGFVDGHAPRDRPRAGARRFA
jgi:hypothetical protein